MKNVLRLRSTLLSMLAMLAIGFGSLSLTACSDDDDDKGGSTTSAKTVEIDGRKTTIGRVEAVYLTEIYVWTIYLYDADGNSIADVDIPDYYLGKSNNLTDDLIYKYGDGEDDESYTGIRLYGCNDDYYYWADADEFKSGTLKVTASASAKTVTVEAKGVTKDDHSFTISYSGKYTETELKE